MAKKRAEITAIVLLPFQKRKRTQIITMSSSDDPKLPQDVAVEILKRLPAESLLRFRCVCRSWRSTIDDPRFVALHLNHSALDASNRYLFCLDWHRRMCSLFSNESPTLPSHSQIGIPFLTYNSCAIVGSCNGLICVIEICRIGYGQTMYLWNLFTKKHKAVRRSNPGHFFMETVHEALGFGFDARSNDYKIVRTLFRPAKQRKPRAQIYSLSTDSWRSLECKVPAFSGCRNAVFLNGNLHWIAFRFNDLSGKGGYKSIVLFDVAGEVFDEMALPEEENNGGVSVGVLNDLLAVLIKRRQPVGHPELHPIYTVCVMRDYGVPESWTKLYTFEAGGLVRGFDGLMWNGGFLMDADSGDTDSGERVSWNPITGQFANLPISRTCNLVTIVKSLVSP